MPHGVSGHLIASAFLDAHVSATPRPPRGPIRLAAAIRAAVAACGPASSPRALLLAGAAPLTAAFGFDMPVDVRDCGVGIAATVSHDRQPVTLIVAPFGARLDPLWRVAVSEAVRRFSSWALLYNGTTLRLVDATRLYARRYLDVDLELASMPGTVDAVCATLTARALCASDETSTRALVDGSDRHAAGVCRSLRDGVLQAAADVLEALLAGRGRRPAPPARETFEQALTIVYRLLFLLFAEARALVPLWHPVYRESYSVDALRDAAERSTRTPGLWDAVRAMTRLAHRGCRAGDLRVTPFNGRLFAPSRTPLANRRDLDDRKARSAVLALATRTGRAGRGREPITYRDLGVEQLGAVYETLLDYEPRLVSGRVELRAESHVRKSTGAFYTPQPIADYLVRRTLGPLVRGRTPDEILRLRVLDPAMGSGAFLVAACLFLAAAYETALVESGECTQADVDERMRATFRRRVAERCLYGVDLNPMAVQLARLSLWLATLAADKPLTFLDHRLVTGDSLVGAWLSQLRLAPRVRRRRAYGRPPGTMFAAAALDDALRRALPVRFTLESAPDDTLDQVRAKERAHAASTSREGALWRWKQIANAWCAAWFSADVPPAAFGAVSDFLLHASGPLPHKTAASIAEAAERAGGDRTFLHWELEYPEVFFAPDGARLVAPGFDAVIGNPPWDMVRGDTGSASDRADARAVSDALLRFAREADTYVAHGDGHTNRYQLFVERALALSKTGGRIGLVLPWGFAADHGSGPLRRHVTSRCNVDAMVAIDNHRGVFPIHRSVRFALVSGTMGPPTQEIALRLGVDDPGALESLDGEGAPASYPVRLSPAALERLSGPGLAVPYVRTATDLAIAERAASLFPPLGSTAGWGLAFGRELNATDDRDAFRDGGRGWPIVEGKHLSPFRAAIDATTRTIAPADARRRLPDGRCERARLAYRDVASATNRVTLIAAVLPPRCVSTHTVFCLRTPVSRLAQHFLCGLFNSLVVNFLVRLRVTTHVTTAIVERLPIPPADAAPAAVREVAALARLLARGERPEAFARLNALVAALYQLTAAEFEHLLDSFPLVESPEKALALDAFLTMPTRR